MSAAILLSWTDVGHVGRYTTVLNRCRDHCNGGTINAASVSSKAVSVGKTKNSFQLLTKKTSGKNSPPFKYNVESLCSINLLWTPCFEKYHCSCNKSGLAQYDLTDFGGSIGHEDFYTMLGVMMRASSVFLLIIVLAWHFMPSAFAFFYFLWDLALHWLYRSS
jgi:hypothetical protein